MKTILPSLFGGGFMAIGHFVLGYSWQDCGLFGLALAAIVLANQNHEMKGEIELLRARVDTLEDTQVSRRTLSGNDKASGNGRKNPYGPESTDPRDFA